MLTFALLFFILPAVVAVFVAWYFGRQANKRLAECVVWANMHTDLFVVPSGTQLDLASLRRGTTKYYVPRSSK